MSFTAILTVYKRPYLKRQIQAILNSSYPIHEIYVWQNENHVDVSFLKEINQVPIHHIQSTKNLKYHGRFVLCLLLETEYVGIFDDDILPSPSWIEQSLRLVKTKNVIVGANGRNFNKEKNRFDGYGDSGFARIGTRYMEFVGHSWIFRQEWVRYMFAQPLLSLETGEDMQFCLAAKKNGISSVVLSQDGKNLTADLTRGMWGSDEHASYKQSNMNEKRIELYKKLIESNDLSSE